MTPIWAPQVLADYTIRDRGQVFVVYPDRELPRDHTGLVGQTVLVDDQPWLIIGVERRALAGNIPIKTDEPIGLLVRRTV